MGIIDIFFRKVDFGVMMGNLLDGIYVFDVIYKVFVEVNEEGMEVVVVIVVMMRFMCMLLEFMVFKVDYFFFFLIRDNLIGIVLFIGCFLKLNN